MQISNNSITIYYTDNTHVIGSVNKTTITPMDSTEKIAYVDPVFITTTKTVTTRICKSLTKLRQFSDFFYIDVADDVINYRVEDRNDPMSIRFIDRFGMINKECERTSTSYNIGHFLNIMSLRTSPEVSFGYEHNRALIIIDKSNTYLLAPRIEPMAVR